MIWLQLSKTISTREAVARIPVVVVVGEAIGEFSVKTDIPACRAFGTIASRSGDDGGEATFPIAFLRGAIAGYASYGVGGARLWRAK